MENNFKLDRTAFKAMTLQQADKETNYKHLTAFERLKITAYLNSVAYNYDINNPPKMDRTVFEARSLNKNG